MTVLSPPAAAPGVRPPEELRPGVLLAAGLRPRRAPRERSHRTNSPR